MVTRDKQWFNFSSSETINHLLYVKDLTICLKLQIPYYHPLNQWLLRATNGNPYMHPYVQPYAHLYMHPYMHPCMHPMCIPTCTPMCSPYAHPSVHPHVHCCNLIGWGFLPQPMRSFSLKTLININPDFSPPPLRKGYVHPDQLADSTSQQ